MESATRIKRYKLEEIFQKDVTLKDRETQKQREFENITVPVLARPRTTFKLMATELGKTMNKKRTPPTLQRLKQLEQSRQKKNRRRP